MRSSGAAADRDSTIETGVRQLKVVTFNIKHGTDRHGRVGRGRLAETCAGFGADVLALQEVDRFSPRSRFADQMRLVARASGLRATFGEAARKLLVHRYGNALLCRGTFSDVEVIGLPQPANGEYRVAILAGLELEGGERLSVAATHLSFRQGEGVVQLEVVLDRLGHRPSPRLVLGDLNLRPERAEPTLIAAGYQVAPTGPTFPAAEPRSRIDYIAVHGLEVVSAETPDTPMSDHRPVIAEVVG